MKLLTHNMLTSNIIKGVTKGFPLTIEATKVEVKEVDYNPEFVARMIPKIDWSALKQAAEQKVLGLQDLNLFSNSAANVIYDFYKAVTNYCISHFTQEQLKVQRDIDEQHLGPGKPISLRMGHCEEFPAEVVPEYKSNETFLKKTHHALMQVELLEGNLICPETGRKFPVTNGIPNMLLTEDEV